MANIPITFRGGEFTPLIDARADTEKYPYGCRHLENFLPRIYSDATRRPGTKFVAITVDFDLVLPSIVAYENVGLCYENEVVSTLPDSSLMPVFICFENEMVCYENDTVIESQTIVFDIVCYENNTVFHQNEITIFN